jgi:capsular polysaccharide biosynthesis protein
MELKQYWQIIWRRIWIPLLLLGVVAGASLLTLRPAPTSYSTTMRFTVRVKPQPVDLAEYNYDGYYEWLASEYMADDLSAIVSSQAFATDVNRHLAELGSSLQIGAGSIGGITFGDKQHRVLRLDLSWNDPAELMQIAEATRLAMEQDSAKYLNPLSGPGALIQTIDQPHQPLARPRSLTERLQLPVRLLLALGAGLALTFLLDYLDDSIRGRGELEALGIPVLAEVPKGSKQAG